MQQDTKQTIAIKFGQYLDNDDYENFKSILAPVCIYEIGEEILKDKDAVAGLYEKNMKEGKLKFDELQWGKSRVEQVSDSQFDVYFSDFLKHKGISHNYNCKQRVTVNNENLVCEIVHMELPGEKESLLAYYQKVGL